MVWLFKNSNGLIQNFKKFVFVWAYLYISVNGRARYTFFKIKNQ